MYINYCSSATEDKPKNISTWRSSCPVPESSFDDRFSPSEESCGTRSSSMYLLLLRRAPSVLSAPSCSDAIRRKSDSEYDDRWLEVTRCWLSPSLTFNASLESAATSGCVDGTKHMHNALYNGQLPEQPDLTVIQFLYNTISFSITHSQVHWEAYSIRRLQLV